MTGIFFKCDWNSNAEVSYHFADYFRKFSWHLYNLQHNSWLCMSFKFRYQFLKQCLLKTSTATTSNKTCYHWSKSIRSLVLDFWDNIRLFSSFWDHVCTKRMTSYSIVADLYYRYVFVHASSLADYNQLIPLSDSSSIFLESWINKLKKTFQK